MLTRHIRLRSIIYMVLIERGDVDIFFLETLSKDTSGFLGISLAEWIALAGLAVAVGLHVQTVYERKTERTEKRTNLVGALAQELKVNLATFKKGHEQPIETLGGLVIVNPSLRSIRSDTLYLANGADIPILGSALSQKLVEAHGQIRSNESAALDQLDKFAACYQTDQTKANLAAELFAECCKTAAISCAEALDLMYKDQGEDLEPGVREVLNWRDN